MRHKTPLVQMLIVYTKRQTAKNYKVYIAIRKKLQGQPAVRSAQVRSRE